jgi:hypothetical protein
VIQAQLVADLTDDAVVGAFAGALFFIVTYTIMARWWTHAIGTTLVVMDAGLVLTLAPSVLHRWFGLNVGISLASSWYFFGSVCLVGAGVWWRSLVMIRANWASRSRNSISAGNGIAAAWRLVMRPFRRQEQEEEP